MSKPKGKVNDTDLTIILTPKKQPSEDKVEFIYLGEDRIILSAMVDGVHSGHEFSAKQLMAMIVFAFRNSWEWDEPYNKCINWEYLEEYRNDIQTPDN